MNSEAPLPPGEFIVDNSVWQRGEQPAVAAALSQGMREDRLLTAGPLVVEALYSARNPTELQSQRAELTQGLRYLEGSERVWQLCFDAMAGMAAHAPQFHRRPLADYYVAALAHEHRVAVLHYDADYELLHLHSGLLFDHRWVAPRGSLQEQSESQRGRLRGLKRAISARLSVLDSPASEAALIDFIARLDAELDAAGLPRLAEPLPQDEGD